MHDLDTATASNAHLNYAFRVPIAPGRATLAAEALGLFEVRTDWPDVIMAFRTFKHVYPNTPPGSPERNDLAMALHRAFRKTFDGSYGPLDEVAPLRGVRFSVSENDIGVRCERGGGLWEIDDINAVIRVFQKYLGAPSVSFDFQFAQGRVVFGGGTSTCRVGKKPVIHSPYIEYAATRPWDIGSAPVWGRLRGACGHFDVSLDVKKQWCNLAASPTRYFDDHDDKDRDADWKRLGSDLAYRRHYLPPHAGLHNYERAFCDVLIDRLLAVGGLRIAYLWVEEGGRDGNGTVLLRSGGGSDLATAAVLIGAYQDFLGAGRASVDCKRESKGRMISGGSILLEPGKAPKETGPIPCKKKKRKKKDSL